MFDWQQCLNRAPEEWLPQIPFDQIGALVFEPGGSGIGFVKFPPPEIFRMLFNKVKQHGALVVVNEVTTGICRTGQWFGFQPYDLQPDIMAVGKARVMAIR